MQYKNVVPARFISRPNRFVAIVNLDGHEVPVHVKNTGRCKELLTPNAVVYLEDFHGRQGKRKLRYDLIAVEKGNLLINMDAGAPNQVVWEALKSRKIVLPNLAELQCIRPETMYGDSRFDFYVEDVDGRKGFVEVKGVTLEQNGIASFPDAPTERGVKHIRELVRAMEDGYQSTLLFVIRMAGMRLFMPNDITHPAFGETLRDAKKQGLQILAYACEVEPDSLVITEPVPIRLK